MSEEARRPESPPLNFHPFVGLELGERWGREMGELSQRLTHVEQGLARLEQKTDALDAKVDRLELAVIRQGDRMSAQEKSLNDRMSALEKSLDNNVKLQWGFFLTLLGAIIAQKFI